MNENEFGYRIRQALNEGADRLDYKTSYRLEQARQKALAAHRVGIAPAWRPVLAPAGGPGFDDEGRVGWAHRLGLAAPVLALVIGFVAIYQWQHEQRINQLRTPSGPSRSLSVASGPSIERSSAASASTSRSRRREAIGRAITLSSRSPGWDATMMPKFLMVIASFPSFPAPAIR